MSPIIQGMHYYYNNFMALCEFCLGLPEWAGTRKVKPEPIWISWSKR